MVIVLILYIELLFTALLIVQYLLLNADQQVDGSFDLSQRTLHDDCWKDEVSWVNIVV